MEEIDEFVQKAISMWKDRREGSIPIVATDDLLDITARLVVLLVGAGMEMQEAKNTTIQVITHMIEAHPDSTFTFKINEDFYLLSKQPQYDITKITEKQAKMLMTKNKMSATEAEEGLAVIAERLHVSGVLEVANRLKEIYVTNGVTEAEAAANAVAIIMSMLQRGISVGILLIYEKEYKVAIENDKITIVDLPSDSPTTMPVLDMNNQFRN